MPKISNRKKTRALKAQKMLQVVRSRKRQLPDKENIIPIPKENDIECTDTEQVQVETGVIMPILEHYYAESNDNITTVEDVPEEPVEDDFEIQKMERPESKTSSKLYFEYTAVKTNSEDDASSRKYLFRQIFVCWGPWTIYFLCGLSFGLPTVMIPQIRREANSTAAVSEEMASWLFSVFGYSSLPWIVIICIFTRQFGRKLPFTLVAVNTITTNTFLYFSVNTTQILITEIMQGINIASNMTLAIIIVSEYADPRYRGIFLAVKSANIFWGIWVSNAMGAFLHWKYIPLLGICLSFFCLPVFFWPESPQWLASRGRFEDCVTAHRWLRGTDKQSEKELKQLLESQIELFKTKERITLVGTVKMFSTKEFYKPTLISVLMMIQYHFTGKVVCMVYALDIIKKITDSESTAYTGMLILDAVTLVGMYLGCYLSKILKRRQLLFSTCAVGILFLFIISLYLYLIDLAVLTENKIVTITLMTMFSVSISCGPMILSTSIYGELIPLRYKSTCTMICALVFSCSLSTLVKIFPLIVRTFNMSGAFLFYAISSLLICAVLFKYLPETKDRTLQEIEDIFSNKTKVVKSEDKELMPLNHS